MRRRESSFGGREQIELAAGHGVLLVTRAERRAHAADCMRPFRLSLACAVPGYQRRVIIMGVVLAAIVVVLALLLVSDH